MAVSSLALYRARALGRRQRTPKQRALVQAHRPLGSVPRRPGSSMSRPLSAAQIRQRREAATKRLGTGRVRPTGNRAFRKLAASRPKNKMLSLAAGALSKSRAQRTMAERRAVRATAGVRAIGKAKGQRTKREQRGLVRARASYVQKVNRMSDVPRLRAGRAGKIARPKGYTVYEDYSIGKRRPGQGNKYGGKKFGVNQALATVKTGRRRRR
jgi:hypothetical protein